MTLTENQLRDALSHLAATADVPLAQLVTPPAPRRRTTWVLAMATALVAAVAAVVLTVARAGSESTSLPPLDLTGTSVTDPTPTPSPTAPPRVAGLASPQYAWFSLDPASGWSLAGRDNRATVQSGYVLVPGRRKAEVDISLYRAGGFDPTSAMTGTPITVEGTPGWRGPVTDPQSSLTLTSDVWQYAPGAWAVVTDRSGLVDGASAADEASVAAAVRIDDPSVDVTVPFTIDTLPAGLSLELVYAAPGENRPAAWIGFGDDRPGDSRRAQAFGGAVTVEFGTSLTAPSAAPSVRVDGHPAWFSDTPVVHTGAGGDPVSTSSRTLLVDYGGTVGRALFVVDPLHLDRYGDDTLLALARATTPVADLADVSTWVPAASGALR